MPAYMKKNFMCGSVIRMIKSVMLQKRGTVCSISFFVDDNGKHCLKIIGI